MNIEWTTVKRKVNDLVPYQHNPRRLTEDKKEKLIQSLEKFNLAEIPAINLDNTIIAGHQRMLVMQLLGRGEEVIDVRIPSRILSEIELKEYNITSNIPVGLWDLDILEEAFSDIDLKELGLDVDKMPDILTTASIKEVIPQTEQDDEYIMDQEVETDIQVGDLFELRSGKLCHRLMCGDSTIKNNVDRLMHGFSPVLMITDPPYGVNYEPSWRHKAGLNNSKRTGKIANDDKASWGDAYIHFPGNVAYVWHASLFSHIVNDDLIKCGFQLVSTIIWAKPQFVLSRSDYHWQHEPCLYVVRTGKNHNWHSDRSQSTLWPIRGMTAVGRSNDEDLFLTHGTQKPIECMARPIRNNTKTGQTVYDPFVGSGTTMVAAHQLYRNCMAMDIEPKYCQMVIDRMKRLDPGLTVTKL
jgi:DNA modification methylase